MQSKVPKQIIGTFEHVAFPQFGIADLTAKVDTGAYTGALHCTQVREEVTPEGKLLHFSPFDNPEVTMTADEYKVKYVRSSNGKRAKRYFVDTVINVRSQDYPITLSLADRNGMRWPVLIGRRFLRKNRFMVDVRQVKPHTETKGRDK